MDLTHCNLFCCFDDLQLQLTKQIGMTNTFKNVCLISIYECRDKLGTTINSTNSLQDLLPELQAVCQCYEAVLPPAVPVVTPAEVIPTLETEPKPEKTSDGKQVTGIKRKRTSNDASGPPAKKILGDGTRSPTTPVTWRSSSAGIVIKLV